jgi:hypothetical protein
MGVVRQLLRWIVSGLAIAYLVPAAIKHWFGDPAKIAGDLAAHVFGRLTHGVTIGQVRWALVLAVIATFLLNYGWKQWRRHSQSQKVRRISAAKAVRYVAHQSVWGWRQRSLIPIWLLSTAACGEFDSGARNGSISVEGRQSTGGFHQKIPASYWITAGLDSDEILRGRHAGRTESKMPYGGGSFIKYEDLYLDVAELERAWPKAGTLLKLWKLSIFVIQHFVSRYRRRSLGRIQSRFTGR